MNPYAYGWAILPFGCLLIVKALLLLKEYFVDVKYLFAPIMTLFGLSLYRMADGICELLGHNVLFINDTVLHWTAFAERICVLVFHILLSRLIYRIATELDLQKIRVASVRNLIFVGIYFILYAVAELPFKIAALMSVIGAIFQVIWIFLYLIMIYSCYSHICPSGSEEQDVAGQRRRSRFEFVNNMRDRFNEKEERAINESIRYNEERRRKRMDKLQARKNKRNNGKN